MYLRINTAVGAPSVGGEELVASEKRISGALEVVLCVVDHLEVVVAEPLPVADTLAVSLLVLEVREERATAANERRVRREHHIRNCLG